MRGKTAKKLRRQAREATVGKPETAKYKGQHSEIREATGTTRWVMQKAKKKRKEIIKQGGAPWQK